MKKLLLGLAIGGLALGGSIAANKVSAAENLSYAQDFIYTDGTVVANSYDIHSLSNTVTSLDEGDGILRHTLTVEDLSANKTINFRSKQAGQSLFYNNPGDAVFSIRFRTNSLSRTQIRAYYPAANYGMASGSVTDTFLEIRDDQIRYNIGSDAQITGTSFSDGLEVNTWYELTVIYEENGVNNNASTTEHDMVHAYLNDEHLYSVPVNSKADWIGQIYDINIQTLSNSSATEAKTFDIDYLHFGPYNGATAQAPAEKNVSVGDEFELNPIVTVNNDAYDLSVNDEWTPSFSVNDVLTYDANTGKFTAVGPGTTTITYNFNDDMIESVSTNVTVASTGTIYVNDIQLASVGNVETNTLEMVVGESYELSEELFKVLPAAANDKTLDFVGVSNDVYSLAQNKITALKVGESTLTVNSHDAGDASQQITIKVVSGAYIGAPAVGSSFPEASTKVEANGITYESLGTGNKTYSVISVVDDQAYGATFKYDGVATGASYIRGKIDASKMESDKYYSLVAYAKIEGTISGTPTVQLKVDGYKGSSYPSGFSTSNNVSVNDLGDGWYKISTNPVNLDSARLDGFQFALWSLNNVSGLTTYISHASFRQVEMEPVLTGMEASANDIKFSNADSSAPTISLNTLNETVQINVSAIPTAASGLLNNVTYSSSDSTKVSVSSTGELKALAETLNGETDELVLITVECGEYKAYAKVSVQFIKPIETITTEDTTYEVVAGSTNPLIIPVTVSPTDYTSTINVVVSDTTIATAQLLNGMLAVVPIDKTGTITITLSSSDGDVEHIITINVVSGEVTEPEDKPCTGLTVDKSSVTLTVGASTKVTATVTPSDTTDKVEWSSSNTSIATVDQNGNIKAVAAGSATITVKCGNQEKTITVTVNAAETTPTPEEPTNSNMGAIIGGVIGGIVAIIVIAGVVYFVVIKKRKQQ